MATPVTLVDDQSPSGKAVGAVGNPLFTTESLGGAAVSATNPVPVAGALYPVGATALAAGSGNVANASAVATLTGAANTTVYISGFEVTGSGATAGLPVTVTVAGLLGGTRSFTYVFAAGALVGNLPLVVPFSPPLRASAVNTAIVVTCPASGAGGTNNTVVAHGYHV